MCLQVIFESTTWFMTLQSSHWCADWCSFLAVVRTGPSQNGDAKQTKLIDNDSHVTYAHMIIIYTLHRAKALFPPVGWGLIPASLASLCQSSASPLRLISSIAFTTCVSTGVLFTFIHLRWIAKTFWELDWVSGKFFIFLSKRLKWVNILQLRIFTRIYKTKNLTKKFYPRIEFYPIWNTFYFSSAGGTLLVQQVICRRSYGVRVGMIQLPR